MLDPTAQTHDRVRRPLPEGTLDVAVVGAGLGGLCATAWLARAGLKVAVFDQHYVAGGCATMFARGTGDRRYAFDVGVHYVGGCGPGGRIPSLLRGAGAEVEWEPLDPDGFDTLAFPDLRFRIPADRNRYRDRLVETFPAEKAGIDRYVRFLEEVDRAAFHVEKPGGPGWRGYLDLALHARQAVRHRDASIHDVIAECTRDPKLRAVLLGQSGDYGLRPREASALLHAGLQNHYFKGAYYPRGGGQVMADRLCEAIEAAGGSVHLRTGVRRIHVDGGRARGVELEAGGRHGGAFVPARVVVSNADWVRTWAELVGPEHTPGEVASRLKGAKMGGALYLLALGLKADVRQHGLGATNIWQFDSYDLDHDGSDDTTPVVRGSYVTSATAKDPKTPHAPAGKSTVELMTLVPGGPEAWGVADEEAVMRGRYRQNPVYLERKERVEEELMKRFEALFPGLGATVELSEGASPLTHTRYTRASGGSGYGLAVTPGQMFQKRPGYRTPVGGLYLVGASARAGHGIGGVLGGGYKGARRVAEELGRSLPEPPR